MLQTWELKSPETASSLLVRISEECIPGWPIWKPVACFEGGFEGLNGANNVKGGQVEPSHQRPLLAEGTPLRRGSFAPKIFLCRLRHEASSPRLQG